MAKKKSDENTENSEVNSEMSEATEGKDGSGYLPGTAPIVIKKLVNKAKQIETTLKPNFASARDALVAGKEELKMLAHENIDHFSEPDEDGTRTYHAGGVTIEITFEKEKIVTKLDDDD